MDAAVDAVSALAAAVANTSAPAPGPAPPEDTEDVVEAYSFNTGVLCVSARAGTRALICYLCHLSCSLRCMPAVEWVPGLRNGRFVGACFYPLSIEIGNLHGRWLCRPHGAPDGPLERDRPPDSLQVTIEHLSFGVQSMIPAGVVSIQTADSWTR